MESYQSDRDLIMKFIHNDLLNLTGILISRIVSSIDSLRIMYVIVQLSIWALAAPAKLLNW